MILPITHNIGSFTTRDIFYYSILPPFVDAITNKMVKKLLMYHKSEQQMDI